MSNYRKIVSKILTEANSFWADSGVVDVTYAPVYNFENGKPVTVEAYHMTPHTFTKFRIGEVNAWGRGIYLTNKPEDCSFNPETIKDWNKMRLLATFFKPFIYEDEIGDEFRNWLWSEIQKITNEEILNKSEILKHKYSFENSCMDVYYRLLFKNAMGTAFKNQSSLNVINAIKHYDDLYKLNIYDKLGLDGMILPFGKTGMADQSNKDTVWYVCYKPNQIKSYEGNNGNYSLDSEDINESIELTERLFPEIPDRKYNQLLYFTSPKGKANGYTKWFCNQYLKDPDSINNLLYQMRREDWSIPEIVSKHNKLYQAKQLAPIEEYKSIEDLLNAFDHSDYKTNSDKREIAKKGVKEIGEIDGFTLYQINSYNASKAYGAGTRWCTTASNTRYYYDSHKTHKFDTGWSKLIYAINKYDKKYAITVSRVVSKEHFSASVVVYNASDEEVVMYDTRGIAKFNYKTNKLSIDYDDMFNYYNIFDNDNKDFLKNLTDWIIGKYKLSKESLEKEYIKQIPSEYINESMNNSFYEYSNTDSKAIGICGLNRQAAKGDSYTMIIDMPPQEFLSLSAERFEKGSVKWFEEQIKQGVPMAMPFLEIEIEDPKKKIARVYGHEGRHRSLAVSNLGYTQAQCILFIRDFIRNGYKKEDLIGWTIMGQKSLPGNKNTHENNPFIIK